MFRKTLTFSFIFIMLFTLKAFSASVIREGLLGAGAGVAGGAVSGAKGKNLWKGALAGAGVNIIGGALLDSISGKKVRDVKEVDRLSPRDAYSDGYNDGYNSGYKKGYNDNDTESSENYNKWYKEGYKEGYTLGWEESSVDEFKLWYNEGYDNGYFDRVKEWKKGKGRKKKGPPDWAEATGYRRKYGN